jgi:hypothetical protein
MRTYLRISLLIMMTLLVVTVEAGTKKALPPSPDANRAPLVKEFPSYEMLGRRCINIVISPDQSMEALTALAKRLHREDPEASFAIFTDGNDQQFRRYRLWDLHYATPKVAQNPYPKAWANQHYIAHILHYVLQGWKLEIMKGDGVKPPVQWGTAVDLD